MGMSKQMWLVLGSSVLAILFLIFASAGLWYLDLPIAIVLVAVWGGTLLRAWRRRHSIVTSLVGSVLTVLEEKRPEEMRKRQG